MNTQPYYIIGSAREIELKQLANRSGGAGIQGNTPKHFKRVVETEINGSIYWCVPLKEFCEIFELQISDFLDDALIDMLNELKRKQGYYPVIDL
jgi:hypothetical protein